MSRRNLEHLFRPQSVALIGASDRLHSIGATVMRNLLRGGFSGPVWPVNVRHPTIAGVRAYRAVADLPAAPELAVLCTPAPTVPRLIADLGARGTRAAVVISSDLQANASAGESFGEAMLAAAKPYHLRIVGPNCIGILVPGARLNASFAHVSARPGNVAFIAQSGALTTAMLDWALAEGIGFSHFVSLGNAADVDFGDLLDYFAREPGTRAILIYSESVTGARKFMSAARTAARSKPVIIVKSGRSRASARAAHSHSGALAGSDAVYDAAFRRAGVLRVETTMELFDAAQILSHVKPYAGPGLAIVSNGGGPGVMATDALVAGGGELAALGPQTLRKLASLIPGPQPHGNPVDIGGDARPERYTAVLGAALEDPAVHAVLTIHAPTAVTSVAEASAAVMPVLGAARCPAIACWMGGGALPASEAASRSVPVYRVPEAAVGAFLHLARHHRSQALLLEAPASVARDFRPDVARARRIVEQVLSENRSTLTEPESKDVLAAYQVPVVETRVARSEAELVQMAAVIGYPVALKILSPDIAHKSDVGGVVLNLNTAEELRTAAATMTERCRTLAPEARIVGFTLQSMIHRRGAHELLAGLAVDATFGPVVIFGEGGTAVELIGDRALALPPLNQVLARDLISRTRVSRILKGYRDRAPVDLTAVELALIKLSQLAADLPEVVEVDINPLLADEQGVLALDARIRIERAQARGTERFAIRPYPSELEERVEFAGTTVLLRPIRPEDFAQHCRFLARITPEDMRARFFAGIRELSERDRAYLTQIDYEREMAFIAVAEGERGVAETLGVARASTDPENADTEFAVLVRSDLKGQGLGARLLGKLIRYCRERGTQRMTGEVLSENTPMLQLARSLGFRIEPKERGFLELTLELR